MKNLLSLVGAAALVYALTRRRPSVSFEVLDFSHQPLDGMPEFEELWAAIQRAKHSGLSRLYHDLQHLENEPPSPREQAEYDLWVAEQEEDFERAAQLRDALREMGKV